MSALPRLLAYLDADIASRDDLGVGLAAIAAAGPEVALVARLPGGSIDALTALAARTVANARPPRAHVYVSGRSDVALAVGADGVVLRRGDLAPHDVPAQLTTLASVHSLEEARTAIAEGAAALIVGTIWETTSHPGRPGVGLDLIRETATLGRPVYAIGGVTAARAAEAVAAGAWGVATIGAVWNAPRPYAATMALLDAIRPRSETAVSG